MRRTYVGPLVPESGSPTSSRFVIMRFRKRFSRATFQILEQQSKIWARNSVSRREIAFCQTENMWLDVLFILVIDQLLCNSPHPFATKKELSCNPFRSWLQTIGAKRTTYGVVISIYFAAFFTRCKVIIMSVLQIFIGKSRAWFEQVAMDCTFGCQVRLVNCVQDSLNAYP